jgi:hypothetical protein
MNDIPPDENDLRFSSKNEDPPWIFSVAIIAAVCAIVIMIAADHCFDFLNRLYPFKSN